MDFYKSSFYINKFKFPMRDKYLSTIESYRKKIKKEYVIINKDFAKLLKKNKVEEQLEEKKKKYLLMLKLIEDKKKKDIQSKINKQKQFEVNKMITKSISNNNMLLNIMSQSKIFSKYLNNLKESRNNIYTIKNNSVIKNNNTNNSALKNKISFSSTFMTDVPDINNKCIKNKKEIIKAFKNKILKYNSYSNLTLSRKNILKEKNNNQNRRNMKTTLKNFSANNLFTSKVLISRFKKSKLKVQIPND